MGARQIKPSITSFIYDLDPQAQAVYLAGDFNGWDPQAKPMRRRAGGQFRTNLDLPPGEYQYKFVVDGKWMIDPTAERQVTNGLGGSNSVAVVRPVSSLLAANTRTALLPCRPAAGEGVRPCR